MTGTGSREYPHAAGAAVWGVDVAGRRFAGVVTARPGPYSVTLDGRLTVPVSLIKGEGRGDDDRDDDV